jgi:hypothetical protein
MQSDATASSFAPRANASADEEEKSFGKTGEE